MGEPVHLLWSTSSFTCVAQVGGTLNVRIVVSGTSGRRGLDGKAPAGLVKIGVKLPGSEQLASKPSQASTRKAWIEEWRFSSVAPTRTSSMPLTCTRLMLRRPASETVTSGVRTSTDGTASSDCQLVASVSSSSWAWSAPSPAAEAPFALDAQLVARLMVRSDFWPGLNV